MLVRMTLNWSMDVRQIGQPSAHVNNRFSEAIRRELRILLPFFHFDSIERYRDDHGKTMLLYSVIPTNLGAQDNLSHNFELEDSFKQLLEQIAVVFPDATDWSFEGAVQNAPDLKKLLE